jgi:hypothetical protein
MEPRNDQEILPQKELAFRETAERPNIRTAAIAKRRGKSYFIPRSITLVEEFFQIYLKKWAAKEYQKI